ncbi:exodeoxyribonuclease III [Alkalilimnicola sp. S0819]|uniref:exodeoxyribonuclease III n=1 Tax=Alkalilimnicola sp. S0819 TaxID=2613922 RepID=UPI00126167F6|nr:exodeoxyribonuclease III [Alkalilimnicola sp. S0819]KAB7624013.1 exodeoxyribonuclease III [Alkalilimnicola sp. S0819]MPQ16621.1 exodeoxyribonuclease III [Alkalilimnicola sp. S0819]
MKIASWNVNSLKVRLPHVLDWLAQQQPDVLGLQETKLTDENFPAEAIREAGYQVLYSGQKTYNGVAVLARQPMAEVVTDIPGLDDPQRRVLAVTVGGLRFINLYVPNGQAVGSDKYAYKLGWLSKLHDWIADEVTRHEHVAVVGDFNIAPEDADVHDPEEWAGKILCSAPERNAFTGLLGLGFRDTFRQFEQEAGLFSWWDYRMNNFRRNRGLRIDLILASDKLAAHCTASTVDVAPRRLERPSDHAPVVAEFDLP